MFNEDRKPVAIALVISLIALAFVLGFYFGVQHEQNRRQDELREGLERQGLSPYSQIEKGQPQWRPFIFFCYKKSSP